MLLGAFCAIAMAQVAAYSLTSPFSLQGGAYDSGGGIDLVWSHGDAHGAAWVTEPFTMPMNGAFRAQFDVQLQPEDVPGGGLVFVVQAVGPDALGSDGQGLGLEGIAPSVAVELDVRRSDETTDPDDNHVGVDLDGSIDSVATLSPPFALADYEDLHGQVDYRAGELTVYLRRANDAEGSPLLVVPVDLPPGPLWVGFTASAGQTFADRRVDGFTFVAGDDPYAPTDTGDPGDAAGGDDPASEAATGELPRVFFCGCSSASPTGFGPWIGLLGLVLRRRSVR